jgi:hypothetical protein
MSGKRPLPLPLPLSGGRGSGTKRPREEEEEMITLGSGKVRRTTSQTATPYATPSPFPSANSSSSLPVSQQSSSSFSSHGSIKGEMDMEMTPLTSMAVRAATPLRPPSSSQTSTSSHSGDGHIHMMTTGQQMGSGTQRPHPSSHPPHAPPPSSHPSHPTSFAPSLLAIEQHIRSLLADVSTTADDGRHTPALLRILQSLAHLSRSTSSTSSSTSSSSSSSSSLSFPQECSDLLSHLVFVASVSSHDQAFIECAISFLGKGTHGSLAPFMSVLAARLLWIVFFHVETWPTVFVELYLEDLFTVRSWSRLKGKDGSAVTPAAAEQYSAQTIDDVYQFCQIIQIGIDQGERVLPYDPTETSRRYNTEECQKEMGHIIRTVLNRRSATLFSLPASLPSSQTEEIYERHIDLLTATVMFPCSRHFATSKLLEIFGNAALLRLAKGYLLTLVRSTSASLPCDEELLKRWVELRQMSYFPHPQARQVYLDLLSTLLTQHPDYPLKATQQYLVNEAPSEGAAKMRNQGKLPVLHTIYRSTTLLNPPKRSELELAEAMKV